MLISNTGPLVALGTIGLVEILRPLFGSVAVTESVCREVTQSSEKPLSDLFTKCSWIRVAPDPSMPDKWLQAVLDRDEATTIALALVERPDYLLIDERKGRRVAEDIYGLRIIGTAGILLMAKSKHLVPAVRPLLVRLQNSGYYLHPTLIDTICQTAGE
jgi:uncharacterized protein